MEDAARDQGSGNLAFALLLVIVVILVALVFLSPLQLVSRLVLKPRNITSGKVLETLAERSV